METQKLSNGSVERTPNNESNSSKLVEQFKVNGTPFTVVKINDYWFLTLGKYRLTNQLTTRAEAEAEAKDASWERIMQIIQIMINENENEKKIKDTVLEHMKTGLGNLSKEMEEQEKEEEEHRKAEEENEKEIQNTDGSHITTEIKNQKK